MRNMPTAITHSILDEVFAAARTFDGMMTPATLVAYARNPDSPLHGMFEWNDEQLAWRTRNGYANHLLKAAIHSQGKVMT